MASPPKKLKNWEELINDGQNYGDEGKDFTPFEKAVFESIKDQKILKIQDSFLFVKTGHDAENPDHPVQLAKMLATFRTAECHHQPDHHPQPFQRGSL